MDQGVNLPFSSVGIDDVTFGLPVFADGWKGLIITGSSQRALSDASKGGRLLLNVKCVNDPAGVDNGKESVIGLNVWHTDTATKGRADAELATLIRVIFGVDRQINSTAELYNQPFFAKAVTQTSAPTPQYPNPTPQTNWRGYADRNGNEAGKAGSNILNGAGGQPGGAGGMPNFGANQPQQNHNGGGFGQPQQQPQQQNGGGWGDNAGQNNNQQPQQNGQNNGGFGQNNQPQQQPQQNNQQGGNGGWNPQGGGNNQPQQNNQQPAQ